MPRKVNDSYLGNGERGLLADSVTGVDRRVMEAPVVTVASILQAPQIRGASVLAGTRGLDRPVVGCNVVEVPDTGGWFHGGELLFTTGYGWRNNHERVAATIREFYRLRVAAIVVRFGPYISSIPPDAREVADDLGLPIITLQSSVPHMELINELNSQLRGRRRWTLERLREAEDQFLVPGLDEQSIDRVASVLATEIDRPVFVIDLVDDRTVSAWPYGAIELSDERAEASLAEAAQHVLEHADVLASRALTRLDVTGDHAVLCAPLIVARELHGVLVASEDGRHADDVDRFTVAHAGELISFLLVKRLERLNGRREAMSLLVNSLLDDRVTTEQALESGLTLGLRLARPCACILVGSARDGGRPIPATALQRAVDQALGPVPHGVGTEGTVGVLVIQADDDDRRRTVDQTASRLEQCLRRHGVDEFVIATGAVHVGLDGLRQSRAEAAIALHAFRRRGRRGIADFSNLGVERILSLIPVTDVTTRYVASTLGPIADDPELLHTLQVFVECGGRKSATAEHLPLHRSSLEYRLRKLAALLDLDINIPEHQFELWLALRLRQVQAGDERKPPQSVGLRRTTSYNTYDGYRDTVKDESGRLTP